MKLKQESYFLFSGGEVHCKIMPKSISMITMQDYTMNGFMALAQHVEVLRRYGVKQIMVNYPYLPYARQDRVIEVDEPFSLKIFCEFLNTLKLDRVIVIDPHSDVGPALINNCTVREQHVIAKLTIPQAFFDDPDVVWISPDAGAYKKLSKLISYGERIAIGTKIRNSQGQIVRTEVYSPVDITGKECIIVDDICDGGRTFIELSKALHAKGAARVRLYVTHGIFSKGIEPLLEAGIHHIYTTNTFPQIEHNQLSEKEII